jgi:hypothetical protein
MKIAPTPARAPCAPSGAWIIRPVLLTGMLFLAGCANTYEVKIDSLSKPKAEPAISYKIQNGNPLVSDDSLRYKEASGFVRTALSGKGLYEAPEGVTPDLVVNLDYGVGPPQMHRETVSVPVYVTAPGQTHYETVQVGTDKAGNPIYSTVAVMDPPHTELAGYRDEVVTTIVYEKYLRLSASENKPAAEGRPPSQVWTIDATSEGQSHDLRKNLPILVAASIDYIGTDSHGQKVIHIKDGNPDIAFVKKGM